MRAISMSSPESVSCLFMYEAALLDEYSTDVATVLSDPISPGRTTGSSFRGLYILGECTRFRFEGTDLERAASLVGDLCSRGLYWHSCSQEFRERQ